MAWSAGGVLLFVIVLGPRIYADRSLSFLNRGFFSTLGPVSAVLSVLAVGSVVVLLRRFVRDFRGAREAAKTDLRIARRIMLRPHLADLALPVLFSGLLMSLGEGGGWIRVASAREALLLAAVWGGIALVVAWNLVLIPRILLAWLLVPLGLRSTPSSSTPPPSA